MGVHLVMLKMRLDDPLDAVAVHGGGGEKCAGQGPPADVQTPQDARLWWLR